MSTDAIDSKTIQRQQYIDSLLSTVVWENSRSHIGYLGLNGHISKIEYTIDGDDFILPFNTINFDEDGMIMSVFSGNYAYNYILEDNIHSKILRLGVNGVGLGMKFNIVREDRKSIFKGYDEMWSTIFTLNRDSNSEISELEITYRFYPDMDSNECEESHKTFCAKANSLDSLNNWTSITFYGDYGNTTVTREITYIDNPCCIKYFEFDSGDKIIYKIPSNLNGFFLRVYDCSIDRWQPLIPPEYYDEIYGYKDYRLIDNRLYLIYKTGNNWINAVCGVYRYDVSNNVWELLEMGGEDCAFVGNQIKVPHYRIVKYGNCTANNEYEEFIKWIDLK